MNETAKERKSFVQLAKESVCQWINDQPFQLAAALSYYTLFSLAPLMVIAIAIAGFAFGREAAQNQIFSTLQGMIGNDGAQAVQQMIQNASNQPKTGIVSTVIGVVLLLFGAGGVVGHLQTSLNTIWGVAPKPGQGVWGFIRQRFISFAMVLGIGFLLLVSLLVSAFLSAFTELMGNWIGGADVLAHGLDFLLSFIFTTGLFTMMYKFLPDVKIDWRDVWIGAVITALLFTIGKFLIGFYLGSSGVTSVYGAAGSLVTILLWVYYSALILFLGAEFTQVYATQIGSGVRPADNAEPLDSAAQSKVRQKPRPQRQSRREREIGLAMSRPKTRRRHP